jgi:hypothetical protein
MPNVFVIILTINLLQVVNKGALTYFQTTINPNIKTSLTRLSIYYTEKALKISPAQ